MQSTWHTSVSSCVEQETESYGEVAGAYTREGSWWGLLAYFDYESGGLGEG